MSTRTLLAALAVLALGTSAVAPAAGAASLEAAQNARTSFCFACWDPL